MFNTKTSKQSKQRIFIAMKFFPAFIIKRSAEFQASAKQKTHLFVEFVGIPDTELCTGNKKNGGDFPTWDLFPFFQRKCWLLMRFLLRGKSWKIRCLLSNLSHPFYTCWFGSPVGSQLCHPSDELKKPEYISHEEAVLNDSSCALRHTANCWFCHANAKPVFSFSSLCQMPLRWQSNIQ